MNLDNELNNIHHKIIKGNFTHPFIPKLNTLFRVWAILLFHCSLNIKGGYNTLYTELKDKCDNRDEIYNKLKNLNNEVYIASELLKIFYSNDYESKLSELIMDGIIIHEN